VFSSFSGIKPAQTMGWWLVSRVSIFHLFLTVNGNSTAAAIAGDVRIHAGEFEQKPNLLASFPSSPYKCLRPLGPSKNLSEKKLTVFCGANQVISSLVTGFLRIRG